MSVALIITDAIANTRATKIESTTYNMKNAAEPHGTRQQKYQNQKLRNTCIKDFNQTITIYSHVLTTRVFSKNF